MRTSLPHLEKPVRLLDIAQEIKAELNGKIAGLPIYLGHKRVPNQEAIAEKEFKLKATGILRHYLGRGLGLFLHYFRLCIVFIVGGAYIVGVFAAVTLLPLWLLGLIMIQFFSLSWFDVVVIEALLVLHVTALRIGLLWVRVCDRNERMKLRMIGCLFGFHEYGDTGEYWDMIGIDCHRFRVSQCKYCSSRSEEVSAQYW